MVAQVHPDCINASNPYHECTDYCFKKIAERKAAPGAGAQQKQSLEAYSDLPKEFGKKSLERKRQAAAQLHRRNEDRPGGDEAADYDEKEEERPPPNVFARSVEEFRVPFRLKAAAALGEGDKDGPGLSPDARRNSEDEPVEDADTGQQPCNDPPSYENLSERQKKLFDLRMKLNQARKANQTAVIAETRREQKAEEEPGQSRGVSKAQWYEEKKKRMSKVLDANGLDMSRAYMLDTQEVAEEKYEKWKEKEAAFGWDVFNQKSLYKAYKKRADNVPVDMTDYQRQKESDPNFYRDGACLEYGKAPAIPEENVDRMAAELAERGKKRKEFSRRRRHHEEKDIDSINERNEHFNRKIERAFGKYTAEIRNNLERGTALPD